MQTSRILTLASIILGFALSASAQSTSFFHKMKVQHHECKIDFMRNNCWPHPFLETDASQVRNPFMMMQNNGWRLHHTLSHEVFREGDNVLTAVGRNRLHWISTQSPEHRRVVYVLEGNSRDVTEQRVKSVNEALTYIATSGGVPQVLVTHKIPSQASGEWNRNLSVSRIENMPAAALPSDEGPAGEGQ